MPLATKNGSLIVKDGSIAQNCNCCAGGWYCDTITCYSCQLTSGFPNCYDGVVGTSQNYYKVMSGAGCVPIPVSASVSGFSTFVCSSPVDVPLYGDNRGGIGIFRDQTFGACNQSYDLGEVCGGAGVNKQVQGRFGLPDLGNPDDPGGGTPFSLYGTLFSCNATFSRSQSCQPGYAVFKVTATALQQWTLGFSILSFRLSGTYTSPCVSIDSLPSSGSWLSGRTVSIVMSGTYDGFGSTLCTMATQTIQISFT